MAAIMEQPEVTKVFHFQTALRVDKSYRDPFNKRDGHTTMPEVEDLFVSSTTRLFWEVYAFTKQLSSILKVDFTLASNVNFPVTSVR